MFAVAVLTVVALGVPGAAAAILGSVMTASEFIVTVLPLAGRL